ncbi:MAG: TatD family hydrolase [Deltaproteobacteria bacterium]|jgi:TatD DNase family protein|nr:TatD family hydrolase [Deltaproteobacteria bacterium]
MAQTTTTPTLFDAHCHLFLPEFAADLEATLDRAQAAGVTTIVNMGLDAPTNRLALELAEKYPALKAAVGWHPHSADNLQKEDLLELARLAQTPSVVALGEIGLDFYRDHSSPAAQTRLFGQTLELAAQARLPAVIHTREAFAPTVALLRAHRPFLSRVLIHCFTGSWEEAKAYLDLDCHFSIPGVLTFPKAGPLREALAQIPRDRLLLETDAPYLAPVPKRGRRNEPAYLAHSLVALAQTLKLDPLETAHLTTQNARRFFGLPELETAL